MKNIFWKFNTTNENNYHVSSILPLGEWRKVWNENEELFSKKKY